MELMAYVARITGGRDSIDDVDYVYKNDTKDDKQGNTRFLSFFVERIASMPSAVCVDWEYKGDSVVYARKRLFRQASSKTPAIGFITDAAFASELVQLELISRISSLVLYKREELAALPWEHFRVLGVEMAQKGVSLIYKGWCEETELIQPFAKIFDEIAECLIYARPKFFRDIVQ